MGSRVPRSRLDADSTGHRVLLRLVPLLTACSASTACRVAPSPGASRRVGRVASAPIPVTPPATQLVITGGIRRPVCRTRRPAGRRITATLAPTNVHQIAAAVACTERLGAGVLSARLPAGACDAKGKRSDGEGTGAPDHSDQCAFTLSRAHEERGEKQESQRGDQ